MWEETSTQQIRGLVKLKLSYQVRGGNNWADDFFPNLVSHSLGLVSHSCNIIF